MKPFPYRVNQSVVAAELHSDYIALSKLEIRKHAIRTQSDSAT